MNITGMVHVNINCSDYDQSRRFYEMLGFREVWPVPETNTPEVAAAVGMPPYRVRGALLALVGPPLCSRVPPLASHVAQRAACGRGERRPTHSAAQASRRRPAARVSAPEAVRAGRTLHADSDTVWSVVVKTKMGNQT